jgi:hypothetical protein
MKGKDKSGLREMVETQSGDDNCGGRRWRQWTTKVVVDNNDSNGRRPADSKGGR